MRSGENPWWSSAACSMPVVMVCMNSGPPRYAIVLLSQRHSSKNRAKATYLGYITTRGLGVGKHGVNGHLLAGWVSEGEPVSWTSEELLGRAARKLHGRPEEAKTVVD